MMSDKLQLHNLDRSGLQIGDRSKHHDQKLCLYGYKEAERRELAQTDPAQRNIHLKEAEGWRLLYKVREFYFHNTQHWLA